MLDFLFVYLIALHTGLMAWGLMGGSLFLNTRTLEGAIRSLDFRYHEI